MILSLNKSMENQSAEMGKTINMRIMSTCWLISLTVNEKKYEKMKK